MGERERDADDSQEESKRKHLDNKEKEGDKCSRGNRILQLKLKHYA